MTDSASAPAHVHEVLVSADVRAPPEERWLAICLCERGTTPKPALPPAVDDGERHLAEHGYGPESLWVAEPVD